LKKGSASDCSQEGTASLPMPDLATWRKDFEHLSHSDQLRFLQQMTTYVKATIKRRKRLTDYSISAVQRADYERFQVLADDGIRHGPAGMKQTEVGLPPRATLTRPQWNPQTNYDPAVWDDATMADLDYIRVHVQSIRGPLVATDRAVTILLHKALTDGKWEQAVEILNYPGSSTATYERLQAVAAWWVFYFKSQQMYEEATRIETAVAACVERHELLIAEAETNETLSFCMADDPPDGAAGENATVDSASNPGPTDAWDGASSYDPTVWVVATQANMEYVRVHMLNPNASVPTVDDLPLVYLAYRAARDMNWGAVTATLKAAVDRPENGRVREAIHSWQALWEASAEHSALRKSLGKAARAGGFDLDEEVLDMGSTNSAVSSPLKQGTPLLAVRSPTS
jgi:hypothetical protein